MFPLSGTFLQLQGPIPGHRLPLCSATQNGVAAQQAASSTAAPTKGASSGEHAGVPTAEGQLKFLAAKLDLSSDQQEKIRPILQDLHNATVKLFQDENMSRDESLSKVRDSRFSADQKIRAVLNDDQKKKLDQLEQEQHSELHGNVNDSRN
jgi:Spy/CpxP family protein refolding chaperone